MPRADSSILAWRGLLALCCAIPPLTLTRGLGRAQPTLTLVLFGAALGGLALCAWRRLQRGPVPRRWVLTVLLGLFSLNAGMVLGTISPLYQPQFEFYFRRLGPGLAILGAFLLIWPALLWPFLARSWSAQASPVDPCEVPDARWSPALVLLASLGCHLGLYLAAAGPYVQLDSVANLWEPPLFEFGPIAHHPPVYAQLVEALSPKQGPAPGLSLLILLQHVLVIGVALGIERAGRLLSGSPWVGCLAGVLVGVDSAWNMYAQSVMSETLSSSLCVLSALCLIEAERRERPLRWTLAAGALGALATLTRQAMQAWFGVGLIWLVGFSALRPRRSTTATLALAALLPVSCMVFHNYVFSGKASLTGSLGRNLAYRALLDMPELTDPDAPPGDEWERARQLAWAKRKECWVGPYNALQIGMGWSHDQVDKAFVRFYFEQMRRHPGQFFRVTLSYFGRLLVARESLEEHAIPIHNFFLERVPWGLPAQPPASGAIRFFDSFHLSRHPLWLILAALAPLLARGRARRASFLALGGFTYFLLLASLVEEPVLRYRLPGVPLLYLAGGLALHGAFERLARLRARPEAEPEATQ